MSRSNHKQGQGVSLRRRVLSFPTLLSFGVAAAFMLFLAMRFDLDWGTTWNNIRSMNPWWYAAAFSSYYLSFAFRGLRWQLIARNAGVESEPGARVPSVLQSSQLIVIGWFVNSITWLRMGDAYRAYAFAEESRAGFSWSLGTVLAERVMDMATILIVLVLSLMFLSASSDFPGSGYLLIAAFVMALALVLLVLIMKIYGARLARFLPHRFEASYQRFQQGTLGSFKHLPILFVLGLIGWLLEIVRLYFVIRALGLSVSWPVVPIVALGHALLSTVPTPGGVGAVEPGVTGLLLLSFDRNNAVSIALLDRTITYISVIAIGGLVFLIRQVINGRRQRRQSILAQQENTAD